MSGIERENKGINKTRRKNANWKGSVRQNEAENRGLRFDFG